MSQYVFVCPQCKHETAEEVLGSVFLTTKFKRVHLNEQDHDEIQYGSSKHNGGELLRYQCAQCGWILRRPEPEGVVVKTEADLSAWIEDYGRKIV